MAALFNCFGRKRSGNSGEKCEHESVCRKMENVLHCPRCKITLVEKTEEDGIDGGSCSKFIMSKKSSKRDSDTPDSSVSSTMSSQDAAPTNSPSSESGPNGIYTYDYRPMAQGGIAGMSYMPVSKTDPNYNMNHRRRGKAVIFNFDVWNNTAIPTLELPPRLGSEKDKKDLAECLKGLSFEVKTHDNLMRQKFDKVLDKLRREDHSDADCIVIALMTHGEKNTIYLSDGTQLPVNLIWEKFEANNCPTLAGKPKIFIIQACRGKRYDHGTTLASSTNQTINLQNDVTDFVPFSYVIPNASDIIIAFSCPLGHYSWRSPEKGSWFIQSICKVFNESGYEQDLKSLLTSVSREVALNFESDTNHIDSNRKKQVPSTSSTLIRNVNFFPKPLVLYGQSDIITNGVLYDSVNQSSTQTQTNGHQVTLRELKVAVAAAQSTVNGNSDALGEPTASQESVPMLIVPTLSRSGIDNPIPPQTSDEIPALVQSDDSFDETPLIQEEPPRITPSDQTNIPCLY